MTLRAIVFDLDDTLYPERAYALTGFAAVASAFGDLLGDAEQAVSDMRRLLDTEARLRIFHALLEQRHLQVEAAVINSMIDTYRGHTPQIALYPDADAALTRLGGAYKLGLITDGRSLSQWAKIDALRLGDRFDEIIVTGDLGADAAKPNTIAFERMATALDVAHSDCLYVADNASKDFVAPNALGWKTVKILRPEGLYRERPTAPGGQPIYVIQELDGLDPLLPS